MKLKQLNPFSRVIKFTLPLAVLATLAQPALAGSIERLIYYDAFGTVSNFTSLVKFPNQPNWSEQLDDFNPPKYGLQSKVDGQYYPTLFGSYTRGYLEAPTNGNFSFYIASYSGSELWLSTNHTAAGSRLIAFETNQGTALFTGPRLSTRQSAPIALVRGQKYFLEVLQQGNSASNSYVQVGWQRPDGVQEIIPTLHLAQFTNDPRTSATYTTPSLNTYGLNGGNLPTTVATNEGSLLILQSDVIAAQPTTFKWYRNGTLLPGEDLAYLQFSQVHAVDNGASYQFIVTNSYGSITSSPAILSITPDIVPPAITLVDTRGNPDGVRVTYSEPVLPSTATNLANYALQIQGGSSLTITQATLLPDQQSVQLAGSFGFQPGITYQLTVFSVQDQATTPNTLSPNPTSATFVYAATSGTTYTFNDGLTNGFNIFGSAVLAASDGFSSSGYVRLTDAIQYQKGVILFSNRTTVDQFHLKFKTRISGASATPGDGFSVNLAADLPQGTYLNQQKGYAPVASPNATRLVVAFDNDGIVNGVVSPAIVVKWQGNIITNVPAGTGGVPSIHSVDGHWANVDLQLKRGGNLSLAYDGVSIFTNLATGFFPIQSAQLEIAAETSVNYETHWLDDVNINYTDGDIGPAGFVTNPSLTNLTVAENQTATLAVVPTGAAPFIYRWYFNGSLIANASDSFLNILATPAAAGSYSVVVSNEFSATNSTTAILTVTADTTPPRLLNARVLSSGNNQVVLTFSEPLDTATATSTATYNLGFLALYSATLGADGQSVVLSTGTLERDQIYLFTINGLKDRSAAGNPLTTTASFVTTVGDSVDYAGQIISGGAIRYWRFDEAVGNLTVASSTAGLDPISTGVATFNGSPTLGAPSLIPGERLDSSLLLSKANTDWLLVPNGADINAYTDPIAKKSFEFWFNANSVPAPGTANLSAASTLFEQGGANRGLAIYLWRDPADLDPDIGKLVFHAWNNTATDGPGSGWGAAAGPPSPKPAVYAQTSIQAGQTYHVVGVLDGDSVSTNGQLILYVNGVRVATAAGAGQLYAHTSNVQIGRGTTLLHTGDSGTTATFDGVLDDLSLYNTALSSNTVALHYRAGTNAVTISTTNSAPLVVSRLDALGNPNQLLLTLSKSVSRTTATNLANYGLKKASGTVLAITNATLLGGDTTVRLLGSFGFQVTSNYTLTVSNLTDQSLPAIALTPNLTNVAFAYSAPVGTTYAFNGALPVGVEVYGAAYVTNAGSYDGSGFLDLTDAASNQNGAVLFSDRHDVTQARIRFKARLSNGSAPPGAGFSVNIAPDLPTSTFGAPEAGYLVAPATSRLTVSFNNLSTNPPSISVFWQGARLINVLTGVSGVPALNNADGHWANVDINLQISGLLSVSYDGVTIITNLTTGFQPITGAQVNIAAETTASAYETHWFDDVNLNFADGLIGPVTIPAPGQPQGTIALENQLITLSVAPAGNSPFGYQWYYINSPIAGATNRTLGVTVTTNTAGAYKVVVRNDFSSATSSVATVSVQLDQNPAAVTSIAGYGGTVNQVQIKFSKQLNAVSATNLLNYDINTLAVNGVTLDSSGTVVTLFTSQQQNLQTNILTISGLLDYAAVPHALNTNVTFQTGISYYQESLLDGPVRYYRLDETNGTKANTDVTVVDTFAVAQGTTQNGVVPGVPALFTNSPGTAFQFVRGHTNFIQFQAKQWDVVGTNTGNSTGLQFTNHTAEFWFKATSLPYAEAITDTNGNPAITNHAFSLWSEGANSRYFVVYLYGTDSTTTNPAEASLYFNAGNIANDGPGAYQQWGTLAGGAAYAVKVSATVTTGVVYHVVAELEGRADPTDGHPIGSLHFFTNGVWVGDSDLPAGILYSHAGTNIRVGQGTTNFRHDGYQFGTETYDGIVDDIVIYNTLLSPDRITQHYQAALTPPLPPPLPLVPPLLGNYSLTSGSLGITWTGTGQLQRATNATGPFITIPGATSPYSESATNKQVFFRLIP